MKSVVPAFGYFVEQKGDVPENCRWCEDRGEEETELIVRGKALLCPRCDNPR